MRRSIAARVGVPFSILAEQATQATGIFTNSWNKFLFRRFWGASVSSRDVDLVIDSYENVVLRNRFRWKESARDSARNQPSDFAGELIHGAFSPQATAMLTALFLRHTGIFLDVAARRGYTVEGLELSRWAGNIAMSLRPWP